jgi:hypothetical protein
MSPRSQDNIMRHEATHTSSPGSPAVRLRRACATAAGFLAISLPAAACGGGSPPGANRSDPVAQGLAYSACVRAHGVKNFPDPATGPNGNVTVSGAGIDMNSPQMQAAEQACRSLDPGGSGGVSQPLTAAQQQALLRWAACIRASGVPSFPDPAFSGGTPDFVFSAKPDPGMLRLALRACQQYLSGVPGGSPVQAGPKA